MSDFTTMTDTELTTAITALVKKVKKLSKLGPGAAMATAANNSFLRKLTAEAATRGITA